MLPQNLLNNVIFQVTFELPLCDKNINKTMQLRNQNWSDLMIVFKYIAMLTSIMYEAKA